MNTKQNNKPVSVCITGDIDYFKIETIEGCLLPFFKVLDKFNLKITFPITAKAVRDYPERAEYILKRGHEIAIHGDLHQPFSGTIEEQTERLEKAKQVFHDILGIVPKGFRAPQLKHNENTYFALINSGFLYDSSQARNEIITRIPFINGFSYDMIGFPIIKPFLGYAAFLSSRHVPARPFLINNRLLELPVTGPSDWQLILSTRGPRYKPENARRIANIWMEILHILKRKGNQLFTIILHPYIISPFYLEALDIFIDKVITDSEVELKLLGDVAESFLSQNKKA